MTRVLVRAALVLPLAALAACSSITKGSTQTVTVTTDPPGAQCQVSREGIMIGHIGATPYAVALDKSKHNLDIACTKEGYLPQSAAVESEFQGMTFGNILLGGFIGLAVDSSTGAINQYPAIVAIPLVPAEFKDAAARDKFFDARAESIRANAEIATKTARDRCAGADDDASCRSDVEAILKKRDDALTGIESQRATAKLATAG